MTYVPKSFADRGFPLGITTPFFGFGSEVEFEGINTRDSIDQIKIPCHNGVFGLKLVLIINLAKKTT